MSDNITDVTSLIQLDKILASSPGKLTVIDFHATWCGPCKMIAPTFAELARDKTNINFLKCNVDEVSDVAQRYDIRSMPTFVFLRGSTKVHEVQGANPDKLRTAVDELSVGSPGGTTPFSGKGQILGGTQASPAATIGTGGIINLTPQAKVLLALIGAYVLLWYLS